MQYEIQNGFVELGTKKMRTWTTNEGYGMVRCWFSFIYFTFCHVGLAGNLYWLFTYSGRVSTPQLST